MSAITSTEHREPSAKPPRGESPSSAPAGVMTTAGINPATRDPVEWAALHGDPEALAMLAREPEAMPWDSEYTPF